MNDKKLPQCYTTKEVAKILAISPLTLHRMVKEGRIDYFKIGTDHRFTEEAIKKVMENK